MTWKELPTIDPQAFTVLTVPELLAKRRVDPWADLLITKQTIPRDLAAALRRRAARIVSMLTKTMSMLTS